MLDHSAPVTPAALPYGGHLDALAAIFADWTARNRFEQDDGDAESLLLHPDATTEQRHWLHAFIVVWDAEQDRLDRASSPTMTADARAIADRIDFSE